MPFVEQEESIKYEVVEGRQIAIYRPRVEVTLKNLETGQEYIGADAPNKYGRWLRLKDKYNGDSG